MKKILFILPRLTSGGAERQSVTLAIRMKGDGYSVSFLCYSEDNYFEGMLKEAGIPVYWKVCNNFKRIVFVTRFIRSGNYDTVISFMPTPNFLNCLAAIVGKKWRVITSERSSLESSLLSRRGRLFGYMQKYSDTIVCNSENARGIWIKHYPQYGNKIKTIYNTVSLPTITSTYRPLKNGRVNIVIAATIYNVKNPLGLLNAILLMSDEERSRFHIDWYGKSEAEIGDHSEYDRARSLIDKENLQDTISFHDATKEIANKMNECDFVALFSQYEGLPNAICEAMMIGKPVIMTRCSDYNVLVKESENGFLCDWDNAISIKDALLKTGFMTESAIIKMGEKSKQIAESLFSPDIVLKQWYSVI